MHVRSIVMRSLPVAALLSLVAGCGNEAPDRLAGTPAAQSANPAVGEVVEPPFAVAGDAEGLLLLWFDEHGLHSARKRADIPALHREHVRVDSLRIAPDQRLDAEFVYLADMRKPKADGNYATRKVPRVRFEGLVERLTGSASEEPLAAASFTGDDIVLYRTPWCGACKATAKFFREQKLHFVEKDVEKDPQARVEMQQKARAAGVDARGVPVIDFRGVILSGFDANRLKQLISQMRQTI